VMSSIPCLRSSIAAAMPPKPAPTMMTLIAASSQAKVTPASFAHDQDADGEDEGDLPECRGGAEVGGAEEFREGGDPNEDRDEESELARHGRGSVTTRARWRLKAQ
jgi:hypothetical protein